MKEASRFRRSSATVTTMGHASIPDTNINGHVESVEEKMTRNMGIF